VIAIQALGLTTPRISPLMNLGCRPARVCSFSDGVVAQIPSVPQQDRLLLDKLEHGRWIAGRACFEVGARPGGFHY